MQQSATLPVYASDKLDLKDFSNINIYNNYPKTVKTIKDAI